MFSKMTIIIDEIFTVDLTLCRCSNKCQIDGEDFTNFCGLLRKYELYKEFPSYKPQKNYIGIAYQLFYLLTLNKLMNSCDQSKIVMA